MNKSFLSFTAQSLLTASLFFSAAASAFEPAQTPLELGGQVEPNVMFLLDDSGSMRWGYMPDDMMSQLRGNCYYLNPYAGVKTVYCDEVNNRYFMSSAYNTVYYNPAITYTPPIKSDGTRYPAASYSAAYLNGYAQSGTTINLSSNFRGIMDDYALGWGDGHRGVVIGTDGGGRYYTFKNSCDFSRRYDNACYDQVNIGSNASNRTNFANWFSYYRTRILAAKSGVSEAFFPQTEAIRVGYGSINAQGNSVDGSDTDTVIRGVRKFEGAARDSFFSWIRNMNPEGSTPLRKALDDAGQYYSREDDQGPWSTTPGEAGGENYSCRQSYTILTTDGYWNGAQAGTTAARADVDNDGVANTLADVAKYYWQTDLLPGQPDKVPVNTLNKQNQQHMITFGVGLGLAGELTPTPEDAFAAVVDSREGDLTWPNPEPEDDSPSGEANRARLLDLVHAAANGRGAFFNAQDPKEFADALSQSLVSILNLSLSNTPGSSSSARISEETLIYEASYNSEDWTGSLSASTPVEVTDEGEFGPVTRLVYTPKWEAAGQISPTNRNLFTGSAFGAGKGVSMTWANVNKAFFDNDESVFNYIRGSRVDELPSGELRKRESLLGDIVNSSVLVVNRKDFGYLPSRTAIAGYPDYLKQKKARDPVVFAGSNSGYLHAFNGETGGELFAFMPYGVGSQISALADEDYNHRFYVDGKLHEHDAFISTPTSSSKAWRTVLLGGLGAGGKSIFALDVTNPATFGKSNILWEFTDADMGYTFGEPVVGLLADGTWAAIFGNGYGKKSDGTLLDSVLYVVNLETGVIIDKHVLAAKTGGMSSPGYVYSAPGGNVKLAVSQIFVGDLAGNLWKMVASNNGALSTAFGNKNNPVPLFKARAGTGTSAKAQPITVRPVMTAHPTKTDTFMVFFGTGSFSSYADATAPAISDVQSIYGIWGSGAPGNNNSSSNIASRSALEVVKIISETDDFKSSGIDARFVEEKLEAIDWNTKAGWYIDLLTRGTVREGERVVQTAEIINEKLFVRTLLPSDDPCDPADIGWLMALEPSSGGRLEDAVFDYDRDGGVYEEGDSTLVSSTDDGKKKYTHGSGIRSDRSVLRPISGLLIGDTNCYYYGITIDCGTRPTQKRVSWEQIDEE
ncbi:MAG TPA: hypothetical protein ENI17_13875 [Pseudomonas xinjiangensis]|uniref:PilY1 beta-propeller domain-containing protein n=2 Tax=root TaxID=1 RepID=A0A7V1BNN8_9GAMM|nr:hypothetical protein [Halopseudomonas xinjiangensis]HEC48696.1 hypothetical protein [Halopseudomonas xinjiangensis]